MILTMLIVTAFIGVMNIVIVPLMIANVKKANALKFKDLNETMPVLAETLKEDLNRELLEKISNCSNNVMYDIKRYIDDAVSLKLDIISNEFMSMNTVTSDLIKMHDSAKRTMQDFEKATSDVIDSVRKMDDIKNIASFDLNNIRILNLDMFQKMQDCMSGIDHNTRDILESLKDAVEHNDVEKLAEVIRSADAFVKTYDAVHAGDSMRSIEMQKCEPIDGVNMMNDSSECNVFLASKPKPKK